MKAGSLSLKKRPRGVVTEAQKECFKDAFEGIGCFCVDVFVESDSKSGLDREIEGSSC